LHCYQDTGMMPQVFRRHDPDPLESRSVIGFVAIVILSASLHVHAVV